MLNALRKMKCSKIPADFFYSFQRKTKIVESSYSSDQEFFAAVTRSILTSPQSLRTFTEKFPVKAHSLRMSRSLLGETLQSTIIKIKLKFSVHMSSVGKC